MFKKNNGSREKTEHKDKEEMKWIPDHKHKECMICNKQFSILNRRHHCRKCGNLVCSDCSKQKWFIETTNERVCDICYDMLSNAHPVVHCNPHLQILSKPNLFSLIATFEKSWIRSRYPQKYEKYKKQLLTKSYYHHSPKAIQKKNDANNEKEEILKLQQQQQQKQQQQQQQKKRKSSSSKDSNNGSDDSLSNQNIKKPTYQRLQKEKYQSTMNQPKPTGPPKKLTFSKKKKTTKKQAKLKKKWNPLIVVQTGVLYINIMEAQGLPDCDRFSQPDGYCVYYVTNNDPCFGATAKYSTKVHHNTYEPEWKEDETIIITNTTGKLVIELWDYDICDKDDYLGKVEIAISDLFLHFACNQERYSIIDDWFEVELAEEWRIQKNKKMQKMEKKRLRKKNKSMINSDFKTVYTNPHSAKLLRQKYDSTSYILQIPDDEDDDGDTTAIYKQLSTMPLLTYSDTFDEDVIAGKCYIHLQLKLVANWWGNFISHFDPLLPPPPKKIPFNINLFYNEINKLLSYIYPMMDESQSMMDILFWVKYIWATIYILMYGYCVFNPWFAVFWIQFKLLIYSCHSYVKQTVLSEDGIGKSHQFNLPTLFHGFVVFFGIIPSLFDTVNTKNKELINKDKAMKKTKDDYNSSDDDENDDDDGNNKNKDENDMKSTSETSLNDSDDKKMREDEENKEEEITMGAFTTIIGNKVIRVSGLKDNLVWYQELLIWINQTVEYILNLLNWSYVNITSMTVMALTISCLLLIIFRNTALYQYEVLIIGGSIMAYFSKPIQFIQWFLFGLSHWYYRYYCQYTKFKTEISSKTKYNKKQGLDEEDLINEEKEEEEEEKDNKYMTNLDDTMMQNNDLFKNKKEMKKDMGLIKKYLDKIWNKIRMIFELFMDLIFGVIQFMSPIFDISSSSKDKKTKKDFIKYSESEPNVIHKKPATLKRVDNNRLIDESQQQQQQAIYLSADAISHGSGRSVKSKNEVSDLLRRRTYHFGQNDNNKLNKKSKHNFGTIFKFNKQNNDDGYIQKQNKEKKKLKKSKTIKKQPTLLRKNTLKQIESNADNKINSMLTKLNNAKSTSF